MIELDASRQTTLREEAKVGYGELIELCSRQIA